MRPLIKLLVTLRAVISHSLSQPTILLIIDKKEVAIRVPQHTPLRYNPSHILERAWATVTRRVAADRLGLLRLGLYQTHQGGALCGCQCGDVPH
jgi:hypothetical protein